MAPAPCPANETRGTTGYEVRTWGMVPRMFAHSTQNWWWTAHPAAH
ncbi:trp operon leader peptide [Streptomyces sp. NPDC101152]